MRHAIMLPRRKFILGLTGLFCAPAIVKMTSLMPVRSFRAWPGVPFSEYREFIERRVRLLGPELKNELTYLFDTWLQINSDP